jgi:BRCT domain type II-containing protein
MSYSAFIAPKEEKKVSQDTILKGLVFVVTGEFDGISRDNIEALIKRFGGNFVLGISGKVNYLLVGRVLMDNRQPETSKKYLEAEKRGIKILRETDFENLIRDKLGDPTYSLTGKPQAFYDSSPSKEELKVTPIKATGTEMWTDLYQPRTRGDLVGNEGLVN